MACNYQLIAVAHIDYHVDEHKDAETTHSTLSAYYISSLYAESGALCGSSNPYCNVPSYISERPSSCPSRSAMNTLLSFLGNPRSQPMNQQTKCLGSSSPINDETGTHMHSRCRRRSLSHVIGIVAVEIQGDGEHEHLVPSSLRRSETSSLEEIGLPGVPG